MTTERYHRLLAELAEQITEAEAKLRRAAARAPTTAGREDTLAAADGLSAERRRLRATIAREQERRAAAAGAPPVLRDRVELGALSIDPATRTVTVGGGTVSLAKKEYELLRALAAEPTRVWTKAELLREVWDADHGYGSSRTLDSHASRLRRKLNGAPDRQFVVNCWGVGYRLVDELPEPAGA
jgi:DNA-binding winged helix-turn-helix (wHTH) protein